MLLIFPCQASSFQSFDYIHPQPLKSLIFWEVQNVPGAHMQKSPKDDPRSSFAGMYHLCNSSASPQIKRGGYGVLPHSGCKSPVDFVLYLSLTVGLLNECALGKLTVQSEPLPPKLSLYFFFYCFWQGRAAQPLPNYPDQGWTDC